VRAIIIFMQEIKKNFYQNKTFAISSAFFLAAAIFFVGFYFGGQSKEKDDAKNEIQNIEEVRQAGYKFINPLLECETKNKSPILKSLEIEIKQEIQKKVIETNPNAQMSLYYRDLKNGPWFGINEDNVFSPASLLKVPLMMAYFKYAEKKPDIMKKEITFSVPTLKFDQKIKPQKQIEIGKSYTVLELIEFMIRYSDNEATNLLFQNINRSDLEMIFNDLGVSMPDAYDVNNSISVRDYASFFRIMYNASYLGREVSEKILGLLSEVKYENGLSAGIPKEIVLSHKFGERESLSEKGKVVRQIHDCGIVYHSTRPYLICVMTKGDNVEELSAVIAKTSEIIYRKIDENSQKRDSL
jgi:beta-lactamase class A